ncbi:MAG: alpha/beta hydrolase [Anaerolineae bacterium]|nr:alpha/beta hydrolase [Candidatus Roseilinea sp.]MDW8450143.1 alpha/beta hydrolase [Anaerolineae bacterium]
MTQMSGQNSTSTPDRASPGQSALLPVALAASATAFLGLGLAVIAWSRNYVNHNVPLTAALSGELVRFRGRRAGHLAYYAAGPLRKGAPPLVFLHSVNAAASSFEMKPLYDHYAQSRRVIALDLPGYGFSDRSDRTYTPALFRDAILDLIEQELGGVAVDVVALSLSSEFLALAAQARPLLFRTLTFLSATGFSRRSRSLRPNDFLLSLLRMPVWRRPIYDLLTSRPSLRLFLQSSQCTRLDRSLVDYAYATSHQPHAENAPYYFISFKLFTPAILEVYRALPQPCLTIFGQDPFAGYELVGALCNKPNWRIHALTNAGALVHWDEPRAVISLLDAHLVAK